MSFVLAGMMANRAARAAGDAAGASSVARNAAASAEANERHVKDLEERVDRLTLLTLSLGEMLKRKTGATDEEILKQVTLFDLQDGVEDGKLGQHPEAKKCAGCGRVMGLRHKTCLYCGEPRSSRADPQDLASAVL